MIGEILKLRQLLQNRKLASDELEALQNQKLCAVIRHAYENVPYYRSLFNSAGLSPEDIRTVADLKHVPITTKDELRAAGVERITAKEIELQIVRVESIPVTPGEKVRMIISKVNTSTKKALEMEE